MVYRPDPHTRRISSHRHTWNDWTTTAVIMRRSHPGDRTWYPPGLATKYVNIERKRGNQARSSRSVQEFRQGRVCKGANRKPTLVARHFRIQYNSTFFRNKPNRCYTKYTQVLRIVSTCPTLFRAILAGCTRAGNDYWDITHDKETSPP